MVNITHLDPTNAACPPKETLIDLRVIRVQPALRSVGLLLSVLGHVVVFLGCWAELVLCVLFFVVVVYLDLVHDHIVNELIRYFSHHYLIDFLLPKCFQFVELDELNDISCCSSAIFIQEHVTVSIELLHRREIFIADTHYDY